MKGARKLTSDLMVKKLATDCSVKSGMASHRGEMFSCPNKASHTKIGSKQCGWDNSIVERSVCELMVIF
jgi:hypothetical protein